MDVGTISNSTSAAVNSYAAKETKQETDVKKYSVSGKTIGQPKLSEKAKEYYEELKDKYKDMDFILVSKDMKEMAKANAGSFANPNKMVVLIDEEKIERMATDENYRKQYESLIATAQKKMPELNKTIGGLSNVKGFGMQVNDGGKASFFAVMQKSFDSQAKRLEEKRAEKKEEKKKAEKKAKAEAAEERIAEARAEKKEAQKALEETEVRDLFGEYKKEDVVILSANSVEELKRLVEEYNYNAMADSVKSDAEKYLGTVIDFKG